MAKTPIPTYKLWFLRIVNEQDVNFNNQSKGYLLTGCVF